MGVSFSPGPDRGQLLPWPRGKPNAESQREARSLQRVWLRVRVGMVLRFPISASTAAAGAMGSPGHKDQAVWPPGHLCCSAPRSRPAAQHAAWVPVKAKPMPKRGFLHLCTGDQGCRGDTLVSTGPSEDLCFPRAYSHSARCSFHRSDQTFLQISSAQCLGGGGGTHGQGPCGFSCG